MHLAQRARQAPEEQAPLAEEAAAAARRAANARLDAQLAAHDHAVQGDVGQARDEQRVVHAQQDDQRRRVDRDGPDRLRSTHAAADWLCFFFVERARWAATQWICILRQSGTGSIQQVCLGKPFNQKGTAPETC